MAEALGKQSAQKRDSPLESLAQKKRRLKQFFGARISKHSQLKASAKNKRAEEFSRAPCWSGPLLHEVEE